MEKNKLEDIIYFILERATEEVTEPHLRKSPKCPPFSRYRTLIYCPSTRSEQEYEHFINCHYCQSMLEKCEEQSFHIRSHWFDRQPSGDYTPEDVERHLTVTRCESCLRQERYENILSKFARAGLSQALANVSKWLKPLVEISPQITKIRLGLSNEQDIAKALVDNYGYPHMAEEEQLTVDDSAASLLRDEIEKAEADGQQPDTATLLAAGIAHQGAGIAQDALDYYRRAVARSPENFEAYVFLGSALHELEVSGEGEEYFKKAVVLLEESSSP